MSGDFPDSQYFQLNEPRETEGLQVEFRLFYRGPLPSEQASGSRKKYKNAIRRELHPQLREFWDREMVGSKGMSFASNPDVPRAKRNPEEIAEHHKRANKNNAIYRFVPLIGERFGISCSLDILFMRRDTPGGLIQHRGDIDNRIKVLFDALRMPQNSSELPDDPPAADENPFFCLMEDDKFVTGVNVVTDRLLVPAGGSLGLGENDVVLVIGVRTKVFGDPRYTPWNLWNSG